jgi:hypothetical protein
VLPTKRKHEHKLQVLILEHPQSHLHKQEDLRRTYFPYVSYLFEALDPNVMELDISELILTSFNSILLNLTKFTTVNLIAMVTMEHIKYKRTVYQGSSENCEPQ